MSYDLGELERIVAAMLRIGTISALDEASARVQVQSGELTTDWIPFGTARAGTKRTCSMPSIGEQVIIFAPGGDPSQAIVGPSIFQDAHASPSATKDQDTTVFPDGTTFVYDSASNTFTQTVAGSGTWVFNCKNATINAQTGITLNTPNAHLTGNLQVDGSTSVQGITSRGTNISNTHVHSGIFRGGSNTDGVSG